MNLKLSLQDAQILHHLLKAHKAGIAAEFKKPIVDPNKAAFLQEAEKTIDKVLQGLQGAIAATPLPPAPGEVSR